MKPLYFLFAILLMAAASCSKSDSNKPWNPNAMISLRPASGTSASTAPSFTVGVKSETNAGRLTAKEVVEQAYAMQVGNNFGGLIRGFSETMRDIENTRLLMLGIDIVNFDSFDDGFCPHFIEGYDIVFTREISPVPDFRIDTIAYIPNATIRAAEGAVKAAFAREDYETCYKLFDEAFTFIPITGEEWRALKAAGTN